MDSNKIEHLLELYLEGNTSLLEEERLRLYFRTTDKVLPEWEAYRAFFGYYDQAKKENCPKDKVKIKNLFQPWMAVVAIITVVISLQVYSYSTKLITYDQEKAQLVFTQFKLNMEKVSYQFNKGAEKLNYLNYWNQTTQKLINKEK